MSAPDLPVDPGLVAAAAALGLEAAAGRHAALADEVAEANRAYYVEDAPTISDAEYDAKLRELVALEAAFPGAPHAGVADSARRSGRHRRGEPIRRGPP